MPVSRVGKIIHVVHLLRGQRSGRRILDHISSRPVILGKRPCRERIRISVLNGKTVRIGFPAVLKLFKRRENQRVKRGRKITASVYSTRYKGNILHRNTAVQRFRYLQDRPLSHAVGDQIRSGIDKNTAADPVLPVIIMSKTAKARFDTAKYNGRITVTLPDQVAVYNCRHIRPETHLSSGRIGVSVTVFPGNSVMIHHGIHVSRTHKKTETRFAEQLDTFFSAPVRLRDHSHSVSPALQKTADDSRAKGRMIYISVPCHIDKIHSVPAPFFHFLLCNR